MGVYSKKDKDGKLRWYIDFYIDGIRKRECVGHSKTLAKRLWRNAQQKYQKSDTLTNRKRGYCLRNLQNNG
jgi:hypothetical protein